MRVPVDHEVGVMERQPLKTSDDAPLWVFGYGSIVWNVGFEHERVLVPVCARGYRRRFYQGSTDHRGTPAFPGRTATLEECEDEDFVVWGAVYEVSAENRASVIEYLEVREKQYDSRIELDLYESDAPDAEPVIRDAVTYIATADDANLNWLGPADDIADQIARARGPSGDNCDYLYNLTAALRELGCRDEGLEQLERDVRAIRGD